MTKGPDFSAKKPKRLFHQAVSTLLICLLLLTQIVYIPPKALGDPLNTRTDLVIILAEKNLFSSSLPYPGLNFFGTTTLGERIVRYGQDIQAKLNDTRVLIFTVEPTDTPAQIAQVLEKYYFDGDTAQNQLSSLTGVVLVGNVPLPSVKKGDHIYPSLYPYTDFDQKQFLYNPATDLFEETPLSLDRKPEIWHGVIRPPAGGEEGNKLLAEFFDKNHAFYQKSYGYNEFDRKVFFGDFRQETARISTESLLGYQAFTEHAEDVTYLRYTKQLLAQVYKTVMAPQQAFLQNLTANTNLGDTTKLFDQVPDIFTKQMIGQLLKRFYQVVGDYPAVVRDLVAGSGRWRENDTDTFYKLIAQKDEVSLAMIKKANDALEGGVDDLVFQMQKNIRIVIGADFAEGGLFGDGAYFPNYINGLSADQIRTALDCTIYRGSTSDGRISNQVEANRVYNPLSEANQNFNINRNGNVCPEYGGCCARNITFTDGKLVPSPQCHPQDAVLPVLDLGGTLAREGDTSYRSCLVENYAITRQKNLNGKNYTDYDLVAGTQRYAEISSVIAHKEPTNDTVKAQLESKVARDLPVDNPRYVDFQNQSGQYQRVNYINLFRYTQNISLETPAQAAVAIQAKITQKEKELGVKDLLLKRLPADMALETLADAVYWTQLSPQQKYEYVFQQYLSTAVASPDGIYRGIYPQKAKGYESTYLHVDGDGTFLDLSFVPQDINQNTDFEELKTTIGLEETRDKSRQALENLLGANGLELDQSCGSFDGVSIFEWFQALLCWLKNLVPPKVEFYTGGKSAFDFSKNESTPPYSFPPQSNNNASGSSPNRNSNRSQSDGDIALTPEKLDIDLPVRIFSDQRPQLLTVSLLDQNGDLYISPESVNADILLVDQKPADGTAGEVFSISSEKIDLQSGRGTLLITPFRPGTATLYAKAGSLLSESFKVTVTDEKIDASFSYTDAQGNIRYGTTFPAGSTVDLSLQIVDAFNRTINQSGTIDLSIENEAGEPVSPRLTENQVTLVDGIATTKLEVGTKTGSFRVRMRSVLDNGTILEEFESIQVIAGSAVSLDMKLASNTVLRDDTVPVAVLFFDAYGNPASLNTKLDLLVTENGLLQNVTDLDPALPGTTVQVDNDHALFQVKATGTGKISLKAYSGLLDKDVVSGVNIVNEKPRLVLSSPSSQLLIQGDPVTVTAELQNAQGEVIDMNKTLTLKTDPDIVTFSPSSLQFQNGKARFDVQAQTRAGTATVSSSEFTGDPLVLNVTGQTATKLRIVPEKSVVKAGAQPTLGILVEALDQYDNRDTSFTGSVKLNLTASAQRVGRLPVTELTAKEGVATFQLELTSQAGVLQFSALAEGLRSAVAEIPVRRELGSDELRGIPFNALYTTVLGSPVGQVTQPDYLGGWLLFNTGKTQAVTTLIAPPEQNRIYATLNTGGVHIVNEEPDVGFSTAVFPRPNLPLRLEIQDKNTQKKVITAFVEVPKKLPKQLVSDFTESLPSGIYLTDTNLDDTVTVRSEGDRMTVYQDNQPRARLLSDNTLEILSPMTIQVDEAETRFMSFNLLIGAEVVARLQYRLSDVGVVPLDKATNIENIPAKGPGIYITTENLNDTFELTRLRGGFALTMPGQTDRIDESFQSLEDADTTEGIGWQGDFKNQLLFASGNTVGNATKLFASSVLVNLGDPVVSLERDNQTGLSGFSQDVGQVVASYQSEPILKLLSLDYNRDQLPDLLVVLANGRIDLFQNENEGRNFVSQGTLLKIPDGIQSIEAADINSDGWSDLIVSTGKGVKVYENKAGTFVPNELKLDLRGVVHDLNVADMDRDGKVDLVVADTSGDIKIFYGTGTGFSDQPYLVDSLVLTVTDQNLHAEPVVYFPDVPGKTTADDSRFVSINVPDPRMSRNGNANAAAQEPDGRSLSLDFLKLDQVPGLESKKTIRDLNAGSLQPDDDVEYRIELRNNGTALSGLYLADLLPGFMTLQQDSLACDNCGESWGILPSSHPDYPILFSGITLATGNTAVISYRARARKLPAVFLETGDFEEGADAYLDIYARDTDGTSGDSSNLLLYKSIAAREYRKEQVSGTITPPDNLPDTLIDSDKNGIPDAFEKDENGDGIPDVAQQELDRFTRDRDGDGIPNGFDDRDDSGTSIDDISNTIRSAIDDASNLLCHGGGGGGCIGLPLNKAFLAPGLNTIPAPPIPATYPGPLDPGYPVFGLVHGIPFICHGPVGCQLSYFRFYVAPTLTGGVGISVCLGEYYYGLSSPPIPLLGNCFVYAVPVLDKVAGGICEKINLGINQILTRARAFTHLGNGNSLFQVGYSFQRGSRPASSQLTFDNGTFDIDATQFKNARIPDFPDFIMDWVHRQIEEIEHSLLDLPDIYLILPDFSGTFGDLPEADKRTKTKLKLPYKKKEVEVKYIGDVIDYLNTLPFVNLRIEQVPIRFPYISSERIDQLQEYYDQWIDQAEDELKSYGDDLDENTKIRVRAGRALINRVRQNIRTLQSYADFPQEIERFTKWKSRLIGQVVQYLDRIADALGNYYLRNKARLIKWQELYRLIREILKGWQLIPDIFQGYQNLCSTCRNDRFNSMYWKLQLLKPLIPELPIIPFPKWPDVVVDVSNINAVIDIAIPSPKFVPQEIVLPRLPVFNLPELNANVDAIIPALPPLPRIPELFPALPPLPIPKLPDLPPPPKIPQILGAFTTVLKVLRLGLYVFCIYKKGFTLIPEWDVKGTVEHLTERSGWLPIDFLSLSFPTPRIPSIEQIRVDAFVNFRFNVNALTTLVRNVASSLNSFQTDLTSIPSLPSRFVPTIPSVPSVNEQIDLQGFSAFSKALSDLSTLLRDHRDTMLSVDEMQAYLAQHADPAFSKASDALAAHGFTKDIAEVPSSSTYIALKRSLENLRTENERDVQLIGAAIEQKKDLFAVRDLSHLFVRSGIVVAGETSGAPLTRQSQVLHGAYDTSMLDSSAVSSSFAPATPTRYLAQADTGSRSGRGVSLSASADDAQAVSPDLLGLYLFDEQTGQYEPLIAYQAESNGTVHLAEGDVDADGDSDIFYALNNTVFLKNSQKIKNVRENHIFDTPAVAALHDVIIRAESVNYLTVQEADNTASLSWLGALKADKLIGYKLVLYRQIYGFDRDTVTNSFGPDRIYYVTSSFSESEVQKLAGAETAKTDVVLLDDLTVPATVLPLPNGTYYGKLYPLAIEGALGTGMAINLIQPQRSSNNTPPRALVSGGNVHEVPVLQTLTLDASVSRSDGSRIVSYFWDLDPDTDSDGDGITTNDPDRFETFSGIRNEDRKNDDNNDNDTNDINYNATEISSADTSMNNPRIVLGPFTEPGEQRVFLNVQDESGVTASQEIVIRVFVPDISVDSASKRDRTITGQTDKAVAQEPVGIVRVRGDNVSPLKTPSSDRNGQYKTNGDGSYKVEDFQTEPGISVKDLRGNEIAVIGETTGNIRLKDSTYRIRVEPSLGEEPLRLILEKGNEVLATLEIRTDPNRDVRILNTASAQNDAVGLFDSLPNDSFSVSPIPNTAPSFAGGGAVYDRVSRSLVAMVAPDGRIRVFGDGVLLRFAPTNDEKSPLSVDIVSGDTAVARVFYPALKDAIIVR